MIGAWARDESYAQDDSGYIAADNGMLVSGVVVFSSMLANVRLEVTVEGRIAHKETHIFPADIEAIRAIGDMWMFLFGAPIRRLPS